MRMEQALVPTVYLLSAVLIGLTSVLTSRRYLVDLLAIASCLSTLVLDVKMLLSLGAGELAVYKFGGVPPPLGVVFIVDRASAVLATFSAFSATITFIYLLWSMDSTSRQYFYTLALLMLAGVHVCLFTGDMFNLYVSIELVAVSSYALTGFLGRSPLAVRAAMIYGITGIAITSFLLLSVVLLYGSYGTLNMADIALKATYPDAVVALSGRVHGDIVSTTKVSIALTTWVFLFKSGIMPNHFWLPEVYRSAPFQAVALFTSSADIIGIYGLIRLYSTIFTDVTIFRDFLRGFSTVLMVMGGASAIVSSLLVARQRTVRRLVAYSTVAQLSLSLLGVGAGNPDALAGSLLNMVANGLGDMSVLYSAHAIRDNRGSRYALVASRVALVTGFLNLFGVLPILPGFWSKTLLTLGLIRAGSPFGAAIVLTSAGLCAIGYFKLAFRLLSQSETGSISEGKSASSIVPSMVLTVLVMAMLGIGIALLVSGELRLNIRSSEALVVGTETYIKYLLQKS